MVAAEVGGMAEIQGYIQPSTETTPELSSVALAISGKQWRVVGC